jgi:ABC-2 type transport system permease protein
MNLGRFTLVIDIPPYFERDVRVGRSPTLQLLVDATAMVQAGLGSGYASQIINDEINRFVSRSEPVPRPPVNLAIRVAFNPKAKVWANGLIIVVAAGLSLEFVVQGLLHIPINGSVPLFLLGVCLYLFSSTSIGIFLATVARTMPQLGLLYMLVAMPMNILSGSNTPLDSHPPGCAPSCKPRLPRILFHSRKPFFIGVREFMRYGRAFWLSH